jgi:DNA-binding CsgD family transcriptional regulator
MIDTHACQPGPVTSGSARNIWPGDEDEDVFIPLSEALMDVVGALRQLGATIILPPDLAECAHGPALKLDVRTAELPLGQSLTHSEIQVLRYLPTHLTVPEIARELYRSADTIKTHVHHLYVKLDAHNRSEAVRIARTAGLLASPWTTSEEASRKESSLNGSTKKNPTSPRNPADLIHKS